MCTTTKSIIALGLLLATIHVAYSMEDYRTYQTSTSRIYRITDNGFQVLLDPSTNQWTPEIPGELCEINKDCSAAIVKVDGKCSVVKPETNRQLNPPISVACSCFGFSPSGKFAYFYDEEISCIILVNIETEAILTLCPKKYTNCEDTKVEPYRTFCVFSFDEKYVYVLVKVYYLEHLLIVNTETGVHSALIQDDGFPMAIPHSSNMYIDRHGCESVVVNAKTGRRVGPQLTGFETIDLDRQLIVLSKRERTRFYSARTGALISSIRSAERHWREFISGPDGSVIAVMSKRGEMGWYGDQRFYRVRNGAEVDDQGNKIKNGCCSCAIL